MSDLEVWAPAFYYEHSWNQCLLLLLFLLGVLIRLSLHCELRSFIGMIRQFVFRCFLVSAEMKNAY